MNKYTVNQQTVSVILGWIESNNIAIPEMQRPFVWTSKKVRDLMDSLYRGFPVGYLITWQSQAAPVKGGGHAGYQQILIDGQQRTTALRAAVAGEPVINKHFEKKRVVISFNPQSEEFATATPVLRRSPEWIYDIHEFLKGDDVFEAMDEYLTKNPSADRRIVGKNLQQLMGIKNAQIGIISLSDELDIETVTEIFVRINSKGVPLSSSDFVMSKISAQGEQGRNLRKTIDYFAHLSVSPQSYEELERDTEFVQTKFWPKISWLKNDAEDLYDPTYVDLIRVASMVAFRRGQISYVVRELSGLDPETRKFDPERIPAAYDKFEDALLLSVNEYNFKKFLTIVKSAGFVSNKLFSSVNAVNFAYALFLIMREDKCSDSEVSSVVRRWLVMMLLTGRASGSFETGFERDLSRIARHGAKAALQEIEQSELTDAFWDFGLPQRLESSSINNPQFRSFLASQVKAKAQAFLSKHSSVHDMIEIQGDIHHLVPKDYLRKNGVNDKREYNQVANYAMTETAVNIRIGNRLPADYLDEVKAQIRSGQTTLGEITTEADFDKSFEENAVPASLFETTVENFEDFLIERRRLMAKKMKEYYFSL
ncbi:DUF262 domain-containing protein [Corynebacterium sp. KPL2734]|uniref:GmrSD restriction endonuclease domain-containing protein n=1 Tax=Corynebacterium sp. KPL2734 TaxID=3158312 RepID=UPI0032EDCE0D